MNERQARSLDISPSPSPAPPPPLSAVEIYVGVGRGFYQSGRHSCASTRRPGVAAEQVLIRATPTRSPPRYPPSRSRRPGSNPANVRRGKFSPPSRRNFASVFNPPNFSTLIDSGGFRYDVYLTQKFSSFSVVLQFTLYFKQTING